MIEVTQKIFSILEQKQKKQIIGLVIMMIMGGMLESISVSLTLPLITGILDSQEWSTKWYARLICNIFGINTQQQYIMILVAGLIFVFILKNLFLLLEYNIQYGFIAKSRYHLQKKLINKYCHIDYSFYLNANSGEIIRVLSNDTFYTFTLLTCLLCVYTEIIVSIILIATIVVISPKISMWIGMFLIIEVLAIWKMIKPIMKREGKKLLYENGESNKWALQIINGIKSVKVSNKEDYFEHNYNLHAYEAVDASRKNQTYSTVPRLLIETVTVVAVLLLVLVELILGEDILALVPQLSAFVVAAVRLLPSVNRMSTNINQIPYYEGAVETVLNVINSGNEYTIRTNKREQKNLNISFSKEIVLHNIVFSYPNAKTPVLDKASFTIKKGQSVGIVGASGAGKTTVVDIILGLLKPQSGEVLVDGVNIENGLPTWLEKVSYIPQSVFLIDDTVRRNIAFGIDDDKINDDEVWRALREAQMDEYVMSLENGLDTGVGERGIRLSGGQCQRIGIARALYSNPEVLFFDEATSALDNETESAIMEAIERLKGYKTLVVIAHRLSTIQNCDVVYRVENLRIIEE